MLCDATGEVEWVEKVKASSQGNGRRSNSWDLGVHSTSLIELPLSLFALILLGQTTSNSNCNIVQHLPCPGEELHPPCRRKKKSGNIISAKRMATDGPSNLLAFSATKKFGQALPGSISHHTCEKACTNVTSRDHFTTRLLAHSTTHLSHLIIAAAPNFFAFYLFLVLSSQMCYFQFYFKKWTLSLASSLLALT